MTPSVRPFSLPKSSHILPVVHRPRGDDPEEMARHDRTVAAVEEMLRLHKEHTQAEVHEEDRHELARQIKQSDAQGDALLY